MAKDNSNSVVIPQWIASVILGAFVAWAIGATTLLYNTYIDVKVLKTALVTKGIIDKDLCLSQPDTAKLWHFNGVSSNQTIQTIQNDNR